MNEDRASVSAIIAASMRAAHLVLDGEPKIFVDSLALGLCGAKNEDELRESLEKRRRFVASKVGAERADAVFRHMRATMTTRSRYTEDELNAAIRQGTGQYVILGAGLDSLAYRRRDLEETLKVFEVDLPASQAWKQARLSDLGVTVPGNVAFIPLDLERKTLMESLRAGGFQPDEPAFFSWLGTTQYLTSDATFATLREVASVAPGSEIVFQYQVPKHMLDEENRQVFEALTAAAAEGGEPWLSLFDPDDLADQVKSIGFAEVWDFGPEEAQARYFSGRTDDLSVSSLSHLMKARVGSALDPTR